MRKSHPDVLDVWIPAGTRLTAGRSDTIATVPELETDYLVIGGGATGMAFTDALIAESDGDVVMLDRRHRPGGHWNDAYPFVRLHQPSAYYGVNSRRLGTDSVDVSGPNAGQYERATAVEIVDYFQRVLDEHLLPSNQVRFYGMCDYLGQQSGEHLFISRLTGQTTTVRVRRKVVDATYLQTSVPSTHTPSFGVDPGVRFMAVNDLVGLSESASGFTVMGAGKTAMDACAWLVDNGVDSDAIRWIRPRDAWMMDRKNVQPLEQVGSFMEAVALSCEATVSAEGVDDLLHRLEACGQLLRLDRSVEPTMYRCAILSLREVDTLRTIEHVVRKGRVKRIGAERIDLDEGPIPTDGRQVHVDCTADGLRVAAARPIFTGDRITLQQVRFCQPTFNAAFIGFIEATRADDYEKNRLCPANPYPDVAADWLQTNAISWRAQDSWSGEPDIGVWMEESRLNAVRGLGAHLSDPGMESTVARYLEFAGAGLDKAEAMVAGSAGGRA
jgi:NAD(P)-binding Rossmann-like domain